MSQCVICGKTDHPESQDMHRVQICPSSQRISGSIRVIKRPHGEAPIWVRDKWIGLIIPCFGFRENDADLKTVTNMIRLPTKSIYMVDRDTALSALTKVDPAAAKWYSDHTAAEPDRVWALGADEVEEFQPVLVRE